ncbi:MAG TPA: PSD1 and planctomycete cytochrome C domain-containing protein [Planctomycetia bacterium]|nr:PSD1 and planctomycete cytochrome C domain-containing protein [Planctomycetia bacterium]
MLVSLLSLATFGADPDLFTASVRPILAQNCFKCHGPDASARKANLRLDQRRHALAPAESGAIPIVPGKPDASELVRRILAEDEEERMPPPSSKLVLTAGQKQQLKDWIAAGAEYRDHWAYLPPKEHSLPAVKRADWVRTPIDRFILARLETLGLSPNVSASKETLARRVHLDLVGLPPTPAQLEAFLKDASSDAYEKLVDRLLASPAYGERWARRWLDLARYADTNGYEKDRARSIWPYRDWVIDALNRDLPYDRFTIEQLAGDMLPGATLDQRIATGFHRNTMLNEEGGIDPLEFRFHALTDRMATTGTTWLGLTVGCAQCHTHKYDPIDHREYYGLMAFFNNAEEPEIEARRPAEEARRAEIEKTLRDLEAALPAKFPGGGFDKAFADWRTKNASRALAWKVAIPAKATSNLPLLSVEPGGVVFASGDQTKSDTYVLTFPRVPKGTRALRIEALPDERLPAHGPGRVFYEGPFGDFTLCEIGAKSAGKPLKIARAEHSFATGGFDAAKAIDGHPQTGWSISGGQGRAHAAVFAFAAPTETDADLEVRLLFERHYAAGLGKFRVSFSAADAKSFALDLPPEVQTDLLAKSDEATARLKRHFASVAPELAAPRKEIDALRKSIPKPATTLAFVERPAEHPRKTHVHRRGEFLQPTEEVKPGVPAFLPPLPGGAKADRLTFARWLFQPGHPLTARVAVNRAWAAFFGRGIVRTVEDFGFQGEAPTHPELLDWLALEFVRLGWSQKKLHRLIVTSATYRQDAHASEAARERDPDNRLLSRGPRLRLDAEVVRDAALVASELLSPKIGGPSVFPQQPSSVTTEGAYGQLAWKTSAGADRHRRSLYTYAKRTTPFALFATFDGPSGEVCVARRETSNTPLQALSALNDPTFQEAARALGRRLAAAKGTVPERLDELIRRLLARRIRPAETEPLARFLAAQRERFVKDPKAAKAVAEDSSAAAPEIAAWTAAVRAAFNLDEFVTRP